VNGKKFLEQTYNSEYKKSPKVGQTAVSLIKKDKLVQPSDFNVCPKYLQTATDLDEMTSVHTEAKKFPEKVRSDSSEKKRHIERTFAEDRLDFIHNYNELVIKNKTLAREVARLKLHLGLDVGEFKGTERGSQGKGSLEISKGRLSVKPHQAPILDGPSDFRHLSPITGTKVNYSTPPDHNESKRKQAGLHSTINFNLTSSFKKEPSGECCSHEVQANNLAYEVERLEKIVKIQDPTSSLYKSNLSPSKRVAFHVNSDAQEAASSLQAIIDSLESQVSELRGQLAGSQETLKKVYSENEKRESALRTEIALLTKEKIALSDDKVKLLTDLNKLKYDIPTEKGRGQSDLVRKLAETEALVQKMNLEAESSAAEKHQLYGKLMGKEDEARKLAEIARQHEETIMQLQNELVQVASDNKSPKNRNNFQGHTSYGDQSPSKELGALKLKLEEVTKERNGLASEVEDLKTALATMDGPLRLKRHPKSFHQIARPLTEPKPTNGVQGRKGSAMSEHEDNPNGVQQKELSLGDENERKSDGAEQSLSARVKSRPFFDSRDCRRCCGRCSKLEKDPKSRKTYIRHV
jgi:hypothetical protein